MDGIIVVDKPAGWTSHDVVNRMRRLAGTRRVGHLGTLDPSATGVLPLVVGRATRLSKFFERASKVYDATICFGFATSTYDAEGEPIGEPVAVALSRTRIEEELAKFRGRILQTPPPVSAKKISGERAYKLARKNIEVHLEPVEVEIFRLDLISLDGPELRIEVHCGAGTYIRSIAHDLGQRIGCGAHLSRLRRTASGAFDISSARTLDQLGELSAAGRIAEALIPAADLLPEFPNEYVDAATIAFIRQGRDFRVNPFRVRQDARFVKALSHDGELVAIGEARLPHLYHPVLVL